MLKSFTTRGGQIDLSTPVCMGILNVTPDSFSDGQELGDSSLAQSDFTVDLDKVRQRGTAMIADGAVILDIGGESTRPGASEVSAQEQIERVVPAITLLASETEALISVDTSSVEVMSASIAAGASLVNDIRALADPACIHLIREQKVAVCLMHMQGQPRTMQQEYRYDDVVAEVLEFLVNRVQQCLELGLAKEQLIVDPGFGFGKSVQQNYSLLKHLHRFTELDLPVLAGLSRKSMLGAVTGKEVKQRGAASIAAATLALQQGANIIRAHDVAATVDAIKVHCETIKAP